MSVIRLLIVSILKSASFSKFLSLNLFLDLYNVAIRTAMLKRCSTETDEDIAVLYFMNMSLTVFHYSLN